jgi:hypothetical protein
LIEEVAILDGPGQDTSTTIFEFCPPSSTSNEPNQCSERHSTCPIKVVTLKTSLNQQNCGALKKMGCKPSAHQPSRLHVTSIVWVITRGTQCS